MNKFIVLLLILFSMQARALTTFTLDKGQWNPKRVSHVFIVGHGIELGLQFLQTAVTRAKKIQETYPNDQILVIWAYHQNQASDLKVAKSVANKILESKPEDLTEGKVISYLNYLGPIRSLHFVGHNSATHGFALQSRFKFQPKTETLAKTRSKLTKDAVAVLHGCNTGFYVAPDLSAKLGIPVLGSLTSTDFQNPFEDGNWYFNNSGQFPKDVSKSKENGLSFQDKSNCQDHLCSRLKPNNHPYVGYWGKYKVGLPFYKAFCNFNLTQEGVSRCRAGVIQALKTWPSKSQYRFDGAEDIKLMLQDYFCSEFAEKDTYSKCVSALTNPDERFFLGKQLKCSIKKCQFSAKLNSEGNYEFDGEDGGNEALINEYKWYLRILGAE